MTEKKDIIKSESGKVGKAVVINQLNNQLNQLNQNMEIINQLNQLNHLTNKEKVILLLFESNKTITEISKKLGFDPKENLATVSLIIKRDRDKRQTGLFYDGLVEIKENKSGVDVWGLTNKGIEEANIILNSIAEKQKEIEDVEYKRNYTAEKLDNARQFLEKEYKKEILSNTKCLNIDFFKYAELYPEDSEDLLNEPEEMIACFKIAIERIEDKKLMPRFFNLPRTEHVLIGDFRSKHLNKFIQFKGIINTISDVRPQVTSAKFECPSCGNIISILQLEQKFKEPTSCGCGRKGKFRVLSKELVDVQKIVLEEETEDLKGRNNPRRINIFLKDDLTSPDKQAGYNQGSLLTVTGILMDVPIPSRDGGKLTRFDLVIDVNHVKTSENIEDMSITPDELEEIKEIAKRKDLISYLSNSVAPDVVGYEDIKTSLILSRVKAKKVYPLKRDRLHVLMVSDPGVAKSQMGEGICDLTRNSRMASSLNSSEVGLTGTVIKDDFLGTWTVKAGAVPLANKSICFVDEIDKFSKDKSQFKALNGAMEEGKIRIDKGDVHQTLNAETTIISACNPSFNQTERFDLSNSNNLFSQIGLSGSMLDRFDYIWAITETVSFVDVIKKRNVNVLDKNLLSKYLFYASNIDVIISDDIIEKIAVKCDSLRQCYSIQSYNFGHRSFQAIVRSSIAFAKLKLKKEVSTIEVTEAFDLVIKSLKSLKIELAEEIVEVKL